MPSPVVSRYKLTWKFVFYDPTLNIITQQTPMHTTNPHMHTYDIIINMSFISHTCTD